MKHLLVKLFRTMRDTLKYILFFVPDCIAIKNLETSNSKNLLIIKMDAIGDYILFRNFLKIIREDKKYSKYRITLCGNSAWKDIAIKFDSGFVDEFYWINRKKFLNDISYRGKVLKDINKKDFGVTINPTYSREFFIDTLVKASRSKEKIGNIGDYENIICWQKKISDRYYTKLIRNSNEKLVFEFYRNKNFFEKILGKNIFLNTIFLKIKKRNVGYVVLFTMASTKRKEWDLDNFLDIKKYLEKVKKLKVYIIDKNFQSINDLIDLIANAEFVVSNDTCAYHISVACNIPLICISNGNHFGRFSPYPKEIYNKGIFLYPPMIMKRIKDFDYLSKKYQSFSNRSINEVTVEKVKESINKLLT